jgi:DNA-binding transcriptional MerR regulator
VPLSRHRDYLSIGEVLEAIRSEFPDVSISKIRFLENEGLIAPTRTGAGYRKFYDADVARLKYILSLQRDHFLPLRVIKERLAEWERNGSPSPEAASTQEARPDESAAAPVASVDLSRAELMETAGLTEQQLAGLEDYSVLARRPDLYDGHDVAIARAAAALFRFGVEPRHLRMFRQSAEREADMLWQVVAPLAQRRDAEARARAAETVEVMADLTRALRWALLRSGLRDLM